MLKIMENDQKREKGGVNTSGDVMRPSNISVKSPKGAHLESDLNFINRTQLYNVWLWKKFVEQYRIYGVDDWRDEKRNIGGWRGEYWGKMMRGACMICSVTGDDTLYSILTDSVRDMLTAADEEGRFSTYSRECDCMRWDIWCRKYVLLGFQYYLEICRDEKLASEIITAMCAHADRIMEKIGNEEGKTPINKATGNHGGLNSSSILEPFMRLYNLTGEKRYLDFAAYIVSEGGCENGGVFDLAYEDEKAPFEYPFVKAYEMMSCFEGLIEYARVTKNEKYRQAAIRFGYKLLKTDVTVIGCCGCFKGEYFDNSAKTQTSDFGKDKIIQETCVTVTFMKLCYQLLRLTGDSVFADAIERSYYNAFLGAMNTHHIVKSYTMAGMTEPSRFVFPFDSYSPLRADVRGKKVAGICVFNEDNTSYGCCVAISPAGFGVMAQSAIMEAENGFVINHYLEGILCANGSDGGSMSFSLDTKYPYSLNVKITVDSTSYDDKKTLRFRIPSWSKKTSATVCGKAETIEGEYLSVTRKWQSGDVIELAFDTNVYAILPPYTDGPDADKCVAFMRGPVMLAADARIGDAVYTPANIDWNADLTVNAEILPPPNEITDARLCVRMTSREGKMVTLIDYSSAGKTQDEESICAVWLLK